MSFSQRRIAGVFRAVIGCSVALFVLATGPVLATEPGLVWQTKVPAVESDYGTRHFRSVRQFDGSILALTASSTNVSPRIISPQGEVVGRSEIPSDPYLSWVAGDPWGGVTVHGRPCTGCDEDVLKFDARTGLPRWPQVFRAEALVGATPAGDILVQSAGQLVLLDGYSGSPRWTRPLGAFPLGLSTSTIFGLRYPASGEEIVALAVEDGSERWSVPVPPLFDRLSDRWIHAADTGDVLFAAKTSDGFAVAAYRRDTGALIWGPTQLPRGSLPARPAWVEVEQGGDGSVAVGAEFATPGGGGLLRDVGIWKIDAGGTVTWGPIVTASPPGPNSNDGIDDLLVEEGGEVLFAGFRGADRYLSQPSTRGFVSRLGAEDGRVRWEIPRDASAFGYRFFDLLPDGPDAVDVVASGGYDTVPLRIYRFSRHDGAMLRDRLMVSGRKESSFVQVALQADEERVRIATVSAFGGGLLYRTDLVTSTGEAHSDPSHSHEGISGDIAAVATSGDIVVLRGGSSLAPMEITFMETALTARWRRQIGPLGGTNKSLVVSENEVFVSYASPTGTALVALSAATGETLWGPVFFEGSTSRLLALPNRDVVLVLSDGTSRRLLRVRKENGDVVWNRLSGPGAVAGLSDVDIAADAVGVALSYGSPTGKVLERRGIEDGELSFPPMAFPGQGKALLASQGGSTFLALVPEVQGGAATLRRIDGSGSVAWVRSQSLSELAVGYGKALAADSGHVYLLYEVFDSAFPPREVSGHFVALLRAADGDSSGPPIPVGPRGLWSLKIGPAGLLVYSAGVVSRIDDVLSFGPGDGVLEPVGCGGALDIDLNVRNAQGAVEFSWVSPEAERPPGVTLTNTGRLVGMPLRGGVYLFRVRVTDAAAVFERQLLLSIRAVDRPLVLVSSAAGAVCPGASVTLTAPAGFSSYSWFPGGQTGPSISVSPEASKRYSVVATGPSGCGGSGSILVSVAAAPAPVLVAPRYTSQGEEFEVFVENAAGVAFVWTVENGSILSGQGTERVRVRAGQSGLTIVRAVRAGAPCALGAASFVEVRKPLGLYTVTPCRMVDTRLAEGPNGGPSLALFFPSVITLSGGCGVPSTASAVVVNVTLIPAAPSSSVSICAEGGPCGPSLQGPAGKTMTTSAVVKLPPDGSGRLLAYSGGALEGGHLIVDISGYFE